MSVRTERVGAMVREALGHQFQRNMPEWLDGFITVASVKMSPDLRIATVHVSIFRSKTKPEILIKRLNTHAPEVRKRLADDVEMKHLPELRFFLDDTLDTVERIDKLLKTVREEDDAREAARAARMAQAEGGDMSVTEQGEAGRTAASSHAGATESADASGRADDRDGDNASDGDGTSSERSA